MENYIVPDAFIRFIRRLSGDFSLVQGQGGNCSVKFGRLMYVKASGKRMKDVDRFEFFHKVRLVGEGRFADDISPQQTRPSIEVFLHAFLSSKYVLHLHSTAAVATSMKMSTDPQISIKLRSAGLAVVPYVRPGEQILRALPENVNQLNLGVLLSNHGLVLADNSVQGLRKKLTAIENLLQGIVCPAGRSTPADVLDSLDPELAAKVVWHMQNNWRVTPDHVVFLGSCPRPEFLSISEFDSVTTYLNFISRSLALSTVQIEQLHWFVDLVSLLGANEKLRTLSMAEAKFLESWEPELMRRKMSRGH